MNFRRFVSLENSHLVCSKISIESLDSDTEIKIKTGIDGRQTNSGVQHFFEMEKRVYDDKFMQYVQKTTESGINICLNTFIKTNTDFNRNFVIERRRLAEEIQGIVRKNAVFEIEKISLVYTSLDKEFLDKDIKPESFSLEKIKELRESSYDSLFRVSSESWKNFWEKSEIKIRIRARIE